MYADYVLLFGTLPRANLRLPPRPGMSDMNLTILAPIENSPWQFDINLEPPHLPPVFPVGHAVKITFLQAAVLMAF